MKKTHWLRNILIVLIVCGLVGTVLAAVLFSKEAASPSAVATIQFSFNGAAEGKAPNGYPFDVSGITSDEVLDTALEASGLTGKYTAEQLRESLVISGVYPESIVKRMTQYVSLLDKNMDFQAAVTDYKATEYTVMLYNDFDPSIASGKLTELLENILGAYRHYFAMTNSPSLSVTSSIGDLQDYDYPQQLDAISESVREETRYAEEMVKLAPSFLVKGKGFGDIIVRYGNVKEDIDRIYASISLNAISKDQKRMKERYETEVRNQQFQLESLTEELKLIEEQIKSYDKDGIVYVSTGGALNQIGKDKTDTYDKLVSKRKEVTDRITDTNAKIALYQGRLDDMNGTVKAEGEEDAAAAEPLTEAEKKALMESTEKKLEKLIAKKDVVSSDFAAMLDAYTVQEINDNTVSVTAVRYTTPSVFSGTFVMKVLKTAGPICAVGFMICMVLLIISRRKEEKAK